MGLIRLGHSASNTAQPGGIVDNSAEHMHFSAEAASMFSGGTLVALSQRMFSRVHTPGRQACAVARMCAAFMVVAGLLVALPVRAEGAMRLTVDWSKLADVIRQGGASFGHDEGFRPSEEERSTLLRPAEDLPWVGSSPHLALIARDWGEARGLLGRLSLTDRLRPNRSSRMIVSRVRLSNGRVTPFIQMGLGQWRIDTDLLPGLRRDVELAGQAGGGVEISFAPGAAIAVESDVTILYREQHEAQMVCQPHIWSSLLAARFEF